VLWPQENLCARGKTAQISQQLQFGVESTMTGAVDERFGDV
jgi:hypothetical protein